MLKEAESDHLSKLRTSDIRASLIEKYKTSEYAVMTRKATEEISKIVSIRTSSIKFQVMNLIPDSYQFI